VCPNCGGFWKSPEAKTVLARDAERQFEQAMHRGPDQNDLSAMIERAMREPEGTLPSELRGDGSARGNPVEIVRPDSKDMHDLGSQHDVCGHCRYFDLESGRKEIVQKKLGTLLVQTYEWQMRHLGVSADQLALCGASGGETLVATVSKACDQFRARAGR
jgi:hypothetical protein